jgi:hypothetical protein
MLKYWQNGSLLYFPYIDSAVVNACCKCNDAYLHIQEPFIGVAVGGQNIPGGNPSSLLVWAITAHGRVSNHYTLG